MGGPVAALHPLDRADGSASYKCPSTGSNVLGSVNAPVELPGRRDALKPEDATVEVFVKPGTAPGGVGERYVEGIIRGALGRIILGREKGYPRRGVVITLAILGGESPGRGGSVSQAIPEKTIADYPTVSSAAPCPYSYCHSCAPLCLRSSVNDTIHYCSCCQLVR